MVRGTVKLWHEDEGWGVLTSPAVPGDVFAHFTHVDGEGFISLESGEEVTFDWASPGQDGCPFRATRVVRAAAGPSR
jgi:CspA family cold shock protein